MISFCAFLASTLAVAFLNTTLGKHVPWRDLAELQNGVERFRSVLKRECPLAQPTPANYKTARLKSGANVHVYGKPLFRSFQHKAGVRIPCTCCGMNAFLSHTRALLSRLSPCFDVLGSGSRRC